MNSFTTAKGTELPIIMLKGKPYLGVQQRVQWFVEENDSYEISTEFLVLAEKHAVCRATVVMKDPESGNILRTVMATKSESEQGFPDFIEKCETGAIGRALALIGYGTQFAVELDEGSNRIVDSPATTVNKPGAGALQSSAAPARSPETPDAAPGEHKCPFGNMKGVPIKSMSPKEIDSSIEFIEKRMERPGAVARAFLTNLKAFKAQNTVGGASQQSLINEGDHAL